MIKIFVGSSSGAKSQAKKFIEGCAHKNVKYYPWWEQFTAGETLLETLDKIRKNIDAAVLLLTPELSSQTSKGTEFVLPNQNVLFEFGYFYAALGKANVAIAKYGSIALPSDLGGYIHINGSKFYKPGACNAVANKTRVEFDRWLDALITNGAEAK